MKRMLGVLGILSCLCTAVWAQGPRHELTVQGSGFFTKESSNNGITNKPTYSGGVLAGYRFNVNRLIAVEADYDYFRNAQKYYSPAYSGLKTNVNVVTGSAILRLPPVLSLKPYALAGGGVIVFNPHDIDGIDTQARGTFVYGGGIDMPLTKHIALRGEYRGLVYKVPDFERAQFNSDQFTHAAIPSAGLVFSF